MPPSGWAQHTKTSTVGRTDEKCRNAISKKERDANEKDYI